MIFPGIGNGMHCVQAFDLFVRQAKGFDNSSSIRAVLGRGARYLELPIRKSDCAGTDKGGLQVVCVVIIYEKTRRE